MITGTILERRHFRDIERREKALRHVPVLTTRQYPDAVRVLEARMVSGAVVVSIDHFKRFLAMLRNVFGGEVRSYCSLLDRGRREAILRMKEQWPQAELIVNLRIETSSISQGRRKTIGSTEVLAYGTAIRYADIPRE
ncbi:MAG: YbjQ family protein [Kiritimatiellaeota bacterium]|nr:YbjQ family protein [Kiritimatiellota bacterium]